MTRSDEQRLADLLDAADELAGIVGRGRDAFDTDPILRRAAERLLEIIGEAANGLSEEATDAHPSVPWRDITRLRIVLATTTTGSTLTRSGPSPPSTYRRWPPPCASDPISVLGASWPLHPASGAE